MFHNYCLFHAPTFSKRHRISYIEYQHRMKCIPLTLNVENPTPMLKKKFSSELMFNFRTSDNSKYFRGGSHRLRVNRVSTEKPLLYMPTMNVISLLNSTRRPRI